jgi:hypothetical protein
MKFLFFLFLLLLCLFQDGNGKTLRGKSVLPKGVSGLKPKEFVLAKKPSIFKRFTNLFSRRLSKHGLQKFKYVTDPVTPNEITGTDEKIPLKDVVVPESKEKKIMKRQDFILNFLQLFWTLISLYGARLIMKLDNNNFHHVSLLRLAFAGYLLVCNFYYFYVKLLIHLRYRYQDEASLELLPLTSAKEKNGLETVFNQLLASNPSLKEQYQSNPMMSLLFQSLKNQGKSSSATIQRLTVKEYDTQQNFALYQSLFKDILWIFLILLTLKNNLSLMYWTIANGLKARFISSPLLYLYLFRFQPVGQVKRPFKSSMEKMMENIQKFVEIKTEISGEGEEKLEKVEKKVENVEETVKKEKKEMITETPEAGTRSKVMIEERKVVTPSPSKWEDHMKMTSNIISSATPPINTQQNEKKETRRNVERGKNKKNSCKTKQNKKKEKMHLAGALEKAVISDVTISPPVTGSVSARRPSEKGQSPVMDAVADEHEVQEEIKKQQQQQEQEELSRLSEEYKKALNEFQEKNVNNDDVVSWDHDSNDDSFEHRRKKQRESNFKLDDTSNKGTDDLSQQALHSLNEALGNDNIDPIDAAAFPSDAADGEQSNEEETDEILNQKTGETDADAKKEEEEDVESVLDSLYNEFKNHSTSK